MSRRLKGVAAAAAGEKPKLLACILQENLARILQDFPRRWELEFLGLGLAVAQVLTLPWLL